MTEPRAAGESAPRLDGVDWLRGMVMVLMALDHTKDFFMRDAFLATNLDVTTPEFFLSRWITHFCAPVFIFLAGVGAGLAVERGKTKGSQAWFLLSRGLWLVLLEFTIVKFSWTFQLDYHRVIALVIWAIGCSMIALAGLIYLPRAVLGVIAFGMILGHNAWDRLPPESLGAWEPLWRVLHAGGRIEWSAGYEFIVVYPLIPWIGVMAAGYLFAPGLLSPAPERRRRLIRLGACLIAAFLLLRWSNLYGDPRPWEARADLVFSGLAFLNCEKYPPSLLYLLMTLGPAILVLGLVESPRTALDRAIITLGRVPLFFYLLHMPLIFGLACLYALARYGPAAANFGSGKLPEDYGFSLGGACLIWVLVLAILYPPCRWFAGIKRRHRDIWWLGYL